MNFTNNFNKCQADFYIAGEIKCCWTNWQFVLCQANLVLFPGRLHFFYWLLESDNHLIDFVLNVIAFKRTVERGLKRLV